MFEPRAAPAAACTAVNGGATTMSTPESGLTRSRSSVTNATVSATVLNIFQLPAIRGVLIGQGGHAGCGRSFLVGQGRDAGERLTAEELQRRAAAGGDMRDLVGDAG